jgi:uncharacterized membrane protein (UPF0127 family)
MAPTPDDPLARDPYVEARAPRLARPGGTGYLVALIVFGLIAALAFALIIERVEDDEDSPPPIARPIRMALDRASPATEPFDGYTEVRLALGDGCVRLVVADEDGERFDGLRGREVPTHYGGMLFVFDDTHEASFTMQGVAAPLSIGWYDADGAPIDRAEMVPCPAERSDCPPYSSRGPYRFVVETPGGALPGGALGACPS